MATESTLRRNVTVPLVNVRIPVPEMHLPDAGAVTAQAGGMARAARTMLPPTSRMLYYGGLGLLGVVGVLEWPVVAVAAAGVWVATRTQRPTSSAALR